MATKSISVDNKNFDISYEIYNQEATKDMIFLHGWGSNKEVMKKAFLSGLENFRLIFIDMPGFGNSTNEYVLTTNDYKNVIDKFFDTVNIKKDIIIGHSFGGKVATLISPRKLILLSSAGIVEKKSFYIRTKIKLFKFLKKFFGDSLYKYFASKDVEKMSKNMYETFKNVVDEDFTSHFKEFKNNAIIFWGKDDTATTLQSGKLIASLIENSEFYNLDGNHYFFLQHENSNFIKQIIKDKYWF